MLDRGLAHLKATGQHRDLEFILSSVITFKQGERAAIIRLSDFDLHLKLFYAAQKNGSTETAGQCLKFLIRACITAINHGGPIGGWVRR